MSAISPRLVLGAERGGAGKTTLSLGLLAAWRGQGKACAAFKKGPDYIDSAWLALASGLACRNLDTYMMGEEVVARSFFDHALRDGANLIEGNRGLFDGVDSEGSFSTVELAKLIDSPIVLIIDCTKRTRTAAAVALGCRLLDPDARIAGVILNRISTARQERVTRAAVEGDGGLKVYGVVPTIDRPAFSERRLGLLPPQEDEHALEAIEAARSVAEEHLDVDGLWRLAESAAPLSMRFEAATGDTPTVRASETCRIGYFRDSAFHFYYPENLESLERFGAKLLPINALQDSSLPEDLDCLYIGGGFPEEAATLLGSNRPMREAVRSAAQSGLPIYAECGGLMYLGEKILTDQGEAPMAGVFPVSFAVEKRPQGHGYAETVTVEGHPFMAPGVRSKGHEFHYSRPFDWKSEDLTFALRMERGHGFSDGKDGLVYRNTFATYVHTHALGDSNWAGAVYGAALKHRAARRGTVVTRA